MYEAMLQSQYDNIILIVKTLTSNNNIKILNNNTNDNVNTNVNKDDKKLLSMQSKLKNDLCFVDDFVDYLIRYNKLNNYDDVIEPFNIEVDRTEYKVQDIKSREYEYIFDPPLKHTLMKTPDDPTYF